jgi:hypothetical protein
MSDRFNIPPNWQDMFGQVVREIQNGLSKLESTVNTAPSQRVPVEDDDDIATDPPNGSKAETHKKKPAYTGPKWEYKVVYVNFKGQISAEGEQLVIGRGERRSTFVRQYLDELGAEGWELTGVSPLGVSENSYFVFKRPFTGAYAGSWPTSDSKIEVEEVPEDDFSDTGSTI